MQPTYSFVALALMATVLAISRGPAAPVTAAEAVAWQQRLTPLPKQVSLAGKVTVPVTRLRLKLPAPPTHLDECLAREFAAEVQQKTGIDIGGKPPSGAVMLDFTRTAAARPALAGKRNADQAYTITGTQAAGRTTVRCDALTDVGSYYAMKTLKQLLLPTIRGAGAMTTVDIPLGRIVDWPDLEERGQWGGSAAEELEALSDLKSNLLERHAVLTVDEQGLGHAKMDETVMQRARDHAVRVVPIIHHLEQLEGTGMFRAYPQLDAVGAKSDNPQIRPVCFARPEIVMLVGQWMAELGEIPGVFDVMVWLSEEGKGCQCDQCTQMDRFVAELKTITAAWHAAKKTCPELGLRVLLTQTSYASNDKVLAALEPGVKVSYYHGGLTYNTERKPMIYPLLEEYVRNGSTSGFQPREQDSGRGFQPRWMGVYPTLSSSWLTVAPFSNPEFTHYRLSEFVDKGLTCLVAYIVPTAAYYQVNTAGGFEWAWNAHGRTPRDFAESYAVREGLNPQQFTRWTETIGPPAWDLYGSNFPFLEHWGAPTAKIAAGKMSIGLGSSIFQYFPTPDKFAANIAQCDAALKIAQQVGDPQFIHETEIVRAYTQVLQSVWHLSQILPAYERLPAASDERAAEQWFRQCQTALDLIVATYPLWSHACSPELQGKEPDRFSATAHLMERLAVNIGELMEQHGFVDESKPYRSQQVGTWKTEEFATAQGQTRRLDVTPYVAGPGKYQFQPIWRSGSLGLGMSEAKLVSFPKDNPEELREEAVDTHPCHAGSWVKGDIYILELKEYDPTRGYAVMASMSGGDSTNGEFYFKKLRE